MQNTEKITKRDILTSIADAMNGADWKYDAEVYIAFCQKEVDALDRKAEKARELAAKKRAEGDALQDAVEAVLGNEFEDAKTIAARVDFGDEEVSAAKTQYRLRQLVAVGKAEVEDIKVTREDGKTTTVKGYRKAQ